MQPTKIGRYEIRAELGRGGMATVYRAYDPMFDREVAVKILPHELLHDEQFRGRFDREAKIIARLEHVAIVPVHDVGEEDGQPFFVMRYMTGGSLSSHMKSGPIPLVETLRILQRVAAALDYAHSKGIIHRDLKPDNILFDETGDPAISDFGIAKISQSHTNLTAGLIVGTPTYMSPEQGLGEDLDGRSDIYSLAVILYEMLAGKPPYESNTPLGMVYQHVREPIPHILDVNPDLPVTVEPVLEKALAKKPDERFATATDLANAMIIALRGEAPDLDTTRPVPTHIRLLATQARATVAARNKAAQGKPPASRWLINGVIIVALGALVFLGGITFTRWITGANQPTSSSAALVAPTSPAATLTQPAPPTSTSTLPPPSPTVLPTLTDTVTPTITPMPGLGGADKIALLTANDIWSLGVDGSEPFQVLNDKAPKLDLQWLPDGQRITYIQGNCLNIVNADGQQKAQIACFNSPYLEGFRVSPDGKWAAISIERRLLIVPFDLASLKNTRTRNDLETMPGSCLVYSVVATKGVQWSADSQKVAVLYQSIQDSQSADFVRVLDIHRCHAADPLELDGFPTKNFVDEVYLGNPVLPSYSWDGNQKFVFNTLKRNEGYGDLYIYDMATNEYRKINPIDNTCCYRDARFSPDGKYLLFAFQDLRLGENSATQLYYIPYDQIGKGVKFIPLKVPRNFFSNRREKLLPALRPPIP